MYLNVFNTILIILSHQCLIYSVNADTKNPEINNSIPNRLDSEICALLVPRADDLRKPRPSALNIEPYSGYLHIKPGGFLNMSCSEDKFVSIGDGKSKQITVKCIKGDVLEYNGVHYNYHSIKCNDIPEPEIMPDHEVWRRYPTKIGRKRPIDCFIPVSNSDYRLPIPYTLAFRPSIIVPDMFGNLFIRHNTSFKATCTTAKFQMLSIRNTTEVILTCIERNFLLFNQTVYKFSDFRCISVPKARLLLSNYKCQDNKYSVGAVGFQSNSKFLILYNVCFDINTRSNVYSWYRIISPYRYELQSPPERPVFIKTKQMFGDINVNAVYKRQRITFEKILKSKEKVKNYINVEKELFLSRGHLVAKTDFFYSFQQEATFFCENTAPQWQIFNKQTWRIVEKYFRIKLSQDPLSRHIIITGTYGTSALPDKESVKQTLYLSLDPQGIFVPKYFWKMDYNMDKGDGMVYIGLNDPFSKVNKTSYICENTQCPELFKVTFQKHRKSFKGLVYCCTSASFEKTYGPLDPLKWQKNLL